MITVEPTGGSTGEPGPQVVFGELPASAELALIIDRRPGRRRRRSSGERRRRIQPAVEPGREVPTRVAERAVRVARGASRTIAVRQEAARRRTARRNEDDQRRLAPAGGLDGDRAVTARRRARPTTIVRASLR